MRLDDGVDIGWHRAGAAPARLRPPAGRRRARAAPGSAAPTWSPGLDPDLTPVQQNVVVLPDQHLVLMSDSAAYVSAAAAGRQGVGRLAARRRRASTSLAEAADDPVAAVQWASTFACEDLAMGVGGRGGPAGRASSWSPRPGRSARSRGW